MHDPQTLTFTVKIPLPWKRDSFLKRNGGREWVKWAFADIWHHDPEKDGSDDSCGWFMRARHGDKETLERIVKRFTYEWDNTFTPEGTNKVYYSGLFKPDGDPVMSVLGITLNLFHIAANEHFQSDGQTMWKKSRRFLKKNLLEIMLFAENPVDSLHDGITRKFEKGCDEKHTPARREERIRSMAGCIYSWILRKERPWYRHPRWHIWHWEVKLPWYWTIRRWLLNRCCKCGARFYFGECPHTDQWHSPPVKWFQAEKHLYCHKCSGMNQKTGTAISTCA